VRQPDLNGPAVAIHSPTSRTSGVGQHALSAACTLAVSRVLRAAIRGTRNESVARCGEFPYDKNSCRLSPACGGVARAEIRSNPEFLTYRNRGGWYTRRHQRRLERGSSRGPGPQTLSDLTAQSCPGDPRFLRAAKDLVVAELQLLPQLRTAARSLREDEQTVLEALVGQIADAVAQHVTDPDQQHAVVETMRHVLARGDDVTSTGAGEQVPVADEPPYSEAASPTDRHDIPSRSRASRAR
jgi:hypothetical protein